ncbi:MAG: F0F1 ATP synthase subunit A [Acidimicrobiia bacterium]
MGRLIPPLAAVDHECDVANEVICPPEDVKTLFEFNTPLFSLGPLHFTRTVLLFFLAAAIVIALLYFGLRRNRLVPSKFEAAIQSLVEFVRDGIARDIIGPEGVKYTPYLLSIFMLILVGNFFEVTPFINFPITSRMALPAFLSILTYFTFVIVGFKKNGIRYITDIAWPKSVPVALRPLVGLIEFFSTFALRPLTLAVRLFANMVAGHLMLSLLLGSGIAFVLAIGEIGPKAGVGIVWFAFGLFIFMFELVVASLQAYIFTLLSAVYIQSSLHPEH